MRLNGRRRLYIAASALTAVGAAATLVAGVTFGLFSSQASPGSQTFTAGTVSLTSDATYTCTLTPSDVKPGDSGNCQFNYQYAGNPAWLAVDIAGTSTPAASVPIPYGGTTAPTPVGLFDGTTPLQLSIDTGSALTLTSGSVTDVLLSNQTTPDGPGTGTVILNWSLPLNAGNEYQGASATVTLTVHAVQAKHNPEGPAPGYYGQLSCTQYAACPAYSGFAWN